jgi:hypothetical protein
MNLSNLRRYRLDLETFPIYNDQNRGIALFDLITSFIGAYLLDKFFNLSKRLPLCKTNKRLVYYLLVIPFGIIVHHILAHLRSMKLFPEEFTYLNKKIMSLQPNIYHLLLFVLIIYIINVC